MLDQGIRKVRPRIAVPSWQAHVETAGGKELFPLRYNLGSIGTVGNSSPAAKAGITLLGVFFFSFDSV